MATDLVRRAPAALLRAALPVLLLASAAGPASAQFRPDSLHGGTLEVPINKSQVVSADQPIARAMIGNSEIADIVPLTDRSVYVLGKTMGTTSLTLYDRAGRVLVVMDIAVGPDAQGYREQLARLVPAAQIEAQTSGNSLILTGLANDPGAIDRAVRLAQTYAGENVVNMIGLGASQQVMLEVKFAEVKRGIGENIGVRTALFGNNHPWGGITGPGANASGGVTIGSDGSVTGDVNAGVAAITGSFGIFGRTFTDILGLSGAVVIDALEAKGFAKTLAEPTLVALSGETATFLAGGEFPVPVAQSSSTGGGGGANAITVEFKPFGVSLGFTPTVLGDGTINMIVEPEVSAIDPAASITLNGVSIPGLRTRRASTTLELRDGESFAIAGLLQQDFETTVDQVPVLASIPILGALFRSTDFQKGESELLIVVTPRLVKPIRPDQVRLPTDRVADPDAAVSVLLGEAYDPVPLEPVPGSSQAPATGEDYEY